MLFRPATVSDLDAIEAHYTELLTHEAETGRSTTNWSLGVYPTRQTAAAALAAGTLWVLEREGQVFASVILNHHQDDFYATIGWQYPAPPQQVLVVHTLCIPPRFAGQGLGRECVSRIKQQAAAMGCTVIRLDTWAGNVPAATLYQKNGFSLCGRAQVLFQGKIPEELIFLEYNQEIPYVHSYRSSHPPYPGRPGRYPGRRSPGLGQWQSHPRCTGLPLLHD